MQILAFLFFSAVLALVIHVIRTELTESADRIGAALAGDYRVGKTSWVMAGPALPYLPRHRERAYTVSRPAPRQRVAA